MTPCSVRHCAHLIVACGITRVVCDKKYHDAAESEEIFRKAGIALVYLHNEIEHYDNLTK
jgi:dCMP deaminase